MNDSKMTEINNPFLMISSHIVLADQKQENQRQSMINSSRFTQRRRPIFVETPQKRCRQSRSNSNRKQIFTKSGQKQKIKIINQKTINKPKLIQRINTQSDQQQIAKQNQIYFTRKNQEKINNQQSSFHNRVHFIDSTQLNQRIKIKNGLKKKQQWQSQLNMVKKKLFVQTPQRKLSPEQNQLLNQRQFLYSSRKNKLYQKQSYPNQNHQFNQNRQNYQIQKTKVKYKNLNVQKYENQQQQNQKSQYFISKIKNFISNRKQEQLELKGQSFTFRQRVQQQNKSKINNKYQVKQKNIQYSQIKQKSLRDSQRKTNNQYQTIKPNTYNSALPIYRRQTQTMPIKSIAKSLRQLHKKMLQKSKICQKVKEQNQQLKHQNNQLKQLNTRLKQSYLDNLRASQHNKNNLQRIQLNQRKSGSSLNSIHTVNQGDFKIIQKQNLQYKKKIFRAKAIIKNLLMLGQNQDNNNSILNIKASLEETIKVLQI